MQNALSISFALVTLSFSGSGPATKFVSFNEISSPLPLPLPLPLPVSFLDESLEAANSWA